MTSGCANKRICQKIGLDKHNRWVFVRGSVEDVKHVLSNLGWFLWFEDWHFKYGPVTNRCCDDSDFIKIGFGVT